MINLLETKAKQIFFRDHAEKPSIKMSFCHFFLPGWKNSRRLTDDESIVEIITLKSVKSTPFENEDKQKLFVVWKTLKKSKKKKKNLWFCARKSCVKLRKWLKLWKKKSLKNWFNDDSATVDYFSGISHRGRDVFHR